MLIEQIIEFKLRESRFPGRTCTPTTCYFHDKTKISKRKSASGLVIAAKILQEAMHLTSLYLSQIAYKI